MQHRRIAMKLVNIIETLIEAAFLIIMLLSFWFLMVVFT